MEWSLQLERVTGKALNPEKAKGHLRRIADVAERNTSLGFRARLVGLTRLAEPEVVPGVGKRSVVKLRLSESKARTEAVALRRYEHILKLVRRKAAKFGWSVLGDKETPATPAPATARVLVQDPQRPGFHLPTLTPSVLETVFDGIYERDSHIRLVHDAMSLFVQTQGQMRPHVLLFGEPAAAKTELFKRFKKWYEQDGVERVAEIDGHAMTRAGLEGWVIERVNDNCLPEILLIEEIEKQDEKVLMPLISIMGSAYFSKLNARVDFRGKVPFVVWATCNDLDRLKSFAKGALHSRFSNEWECRRPSRELMHRILLRELRVIPSANPAWAEKALEFGWDVLKTNDPRKLIGLLAGRDRLLDGSYQRDQLQVIRQ